MICCSFGFGVVWDERKKPLIIAAWRVLVYSVEASKYIGTRGHPLFLCIGMVVS